MSKMEMLTNAISGAIMSGMAAYAGRVGTSGSKTTTETNQDGLSLKRARTAYGGRKRMKIMKLMTSGVKSVEQNLGVYNTVSTTFTKKHPVSEYNLGTGGFMGICKDSNANVTPMHIYDLNMFVGASQDNPINFPLYSTAQCSDANQRAWVFGNDNKFYGLNTDLTNFTKDTPYTNHQFRYFVDDPRGNNLTQNPSEKVFRKSIAINYTLYGAKYMSLEYDLKVIKITDPAMCPDYLATLSNEELKKFQQGWQNLIRAQTINPMLLGVEPGPKLKRWFKVVASKRVKIGEVIDANIMPTVTGKIYVKQNELNNYAYDQMRNFNVETGDATYDNVPAPDDNAANNTFVHKPYYTSRYYLMIRCTGTVDQSRNGQDGANPHTSANSTDITTAPNGWYGFWDDGIPPRSAAPDSYNILGTQGSYDLAIKTFFLVNTANS